MKALDSIDYDKFEEASNLLASKNVWQTPTLFLYRNSAQKIFKDLSFINELNKLPNQIKQKWIKEIADTDTIIDKNSLRYSKWLEEATGKLHKKNVPFMAGTDTPIGYLIPGRSLHIELEVMVESGFSNLEAIKSVKGIGLKTAQRLLIDLKDKILKIIETEDQIELPKNNTIKDETLSALEVLGYPRRQVEKLVDNIIQSYPESSVEELIKQALNKL